MDGFVCAGDALYECSNPRDASDPGLCVLVNVCQGHCQDTSDFDAFCRPGPKPVGLRELPRDDPGSCTCQDSSDCDRGMACDGCYCVPAVPADGDDDGDEGPLLCDASADCPAGQYCSRVGSPDQRGYCTYQCRTKKDCGDGQSCTDRGYCIAAMDMDREFVFVDMEEERDEEGLPPGYCIRDRECGPGRYCDFPAHTCRKGPRPCKSDDDCQVGACIQGACGVSTNPAK